MFCPFCNAEETRVIDSRLMGSGNQIRRRRECAECQERFTTFEVAELVMPRVIKRDGARVPFDEHKLRTGMLRSLEKRPVSVEAFEDAFGDVMYKVRATGEREVSSEFIGEAVMEVLGRLDQVAYVRFASVYKQFEDVTEFSKEIQRLQRATDSVKDKH